MKLVAADANSVTVRLSERESQIAHNSLNSVINGIRIPESEYEDRLGGTREELAEFFDGVKGPQSIGMDGLTFRLSASDLLLLRNAMREVTEGIEIEEWEFQTRLGWPMAEAKLLLGEIEDLIRTFSH